MSDQPQCAECGAELPLRTHGGLCSKCLLKVGLEEAARHDHLHVRCPHCRNPIEIVDNTPLRDITCPSCDSKFSLISDETTSIARDISKAIGQFELIEQVGIGGFGSVWKAHDTELDRTVAVKVPRRDQLSSADVEQFMREARAAAQLKHPNIVSVHEVGSSNGQVYIVSDYIEGVTLADWLSAHEPSPREAAGLCAHLAEALHHAHHSGIIHRDLKPSNVMIDERGEPHIMDFGLAKRDAGEITMTVDGRVLGTPAYMSPEQARGKGHDADACSDVYSLGVILFEILTSEKPFRGTSRMLLHQVIHDDAPQPRKLNGAVPRDVETICLKCLEKEPNRRYQSAAELCDELRRFLANRPILARPITSIERSRRWCQRNPLVATLGAAVAALLIAVSIAGLLIAWKEAKYSRIVVESARHARQLLYTSDMAVAQHSFEQANIQRAKELLRRQIPQAGAEDRRGFEWHYLWDQCHSEVTTYKYEDQALYGAAHVAFSPDGKLLAMTRPAGHTPLIVWNRITHETVAFEQPNVGYQSRPEFSTDGKLLSVDGAVFNVETGKLWRLFENVGASDYSHGSAFSQDGKRVAFGDERGDVHVYDVQSQQCESFHAHEERVRGLRFSPNGDLLATLVRPLVSYEEKQFPAELKIWDAQWKTLVAKVDDLVEPGAQMRFSPDSSLLAFSEKNSVILSDVTNGQIVRSLDAHTKSVTELCFSPDGKFLCSGGRDNTLRLWAVGTGRHLATMRGHSRLISSLAFSPDGEQIASASMDGTVKLWDVRRVQRHPTVHMHEKMVAHQLVFDGSKLVSYGKSPGMTAAHRVDGTPKTEVSTYEIGRNSIMPKFTSESRTIYLLGKSLDAAAIAIGTDHRELKLWQLDDPSTARLLADDVDDVTSATISNDGTTIALGRGSRRVEIWNAPSSQVQQTIEVAAHYLDLSLSDDGSLLAVTFFEGNQVRIYDARSGDELHEFTEASPQPARFSPDSKLLAIPTAAGSVTVWDLAEEKQTQKLLGHTGGVWVVAFAPDGKTIASGSHDQTVRLWDVKTGEPRLVLNEPDDSVVSLAFDRRGKTLAAGCINGKVFFWQAASSPLLSTDQIRDVPEDERLRRVFEAAEIALVSIETNSSDALQHWRTAVDLATNVPETRLALAELYNERAWKLVVSPDEGLETHEEATDLAQKAIAIQPLADYLTTLGAAHYRAGNWKSSIDAIQHSMASRPVTDPNDCLFLAMNYWQLDNQEKARQWYERAKQVLQNREFPEEDLRKLQRETAALLGVTEEGMTE